ncbi:MAG: GNAT family N-acetyltransferase [Fimbriimonadales bacterium]
MTETKALRRCVVETYLALARCAPGAKVELIDDAWVCRSAIRHPIGNFAIGFGGTSLPESIVNQAMERAHFRMFLITGDTPTGLDALAVNAGLRLRYELIGMTLSKPLALEVSVQEADATNVGEVAGFIADTFFWRSTAKNRAVLAGIMAAAHPKHRFYYAKDDSGIVVAGTLTLDEECIGLYNLCVRDDARSRGVGAAFTAELSRRAMGLADHVALLCDESMVPWYSRQGYASAGSVRAFSA